MRKTALFVVLSIFSVLLCTCLPQKRPGAGVAVKDASGAWVSDSEKFALEYPGVGSDNIFVIRTAEQTAQILERGTGIVFLGFKECPWCQRYAVYLQEAAREVELNRIFYCDIKKDRDDNTESYKKIISALSGRLQFDDEGHEKIFVPDVTIIDSGEIIGRDYETSKDTLGCDTPDQYWTRARVLALQYRLKGYMSQLQKPCNICNH